MSRAPEYEIVPVDTAQDEAQMVKDYERISNTVMQPGSPEQLMVKWVSDIVIQNRQRVNYAGNQNLASRAEHENLDGVAELFYLTERPAAQPAVCTMRFYISEAQSQPVLIPGGTRVTDVGATIYWETLEDNFIPAGDTYMDVRVQCQTAGAIGNGYLPGQINTLVDIYDFYESCENITASANGSDVPGDDAFYELLRESQAAWSTAGAYDSYVFWAKTSAGSIADVIANSPSAGVVSLYILMDDGTIATSETKNAAVEACRKEDRRPLTDFVQSADPVVVDYQIDVTYYLYRNGTIPASEMEKLVNTAIEEFKLWQSSKLGRDINDSRLHDMLMATGVKRVVIRSPSFKTLVSGIPTVYGSDPPPEIAKCTSVNVVNGGYEDE